MYLKEYKGRWYAMGYKDGLKGVYRLPIDRIRDFSYAILPFPEELNFSPQEYFKDIIGVTKLSGEPKEIQFIVKNKIAPYIKLNPLHHSQKLVENRENGDMVFTINIIPNREFYNIIFENQPNIQIISPREIGLQANSTVIDLLQELPDYTKPEKAADTSNSDALDDGFNLFSNL
jgi:predicted DNA-binding transcriptional regulator YafY